MALLTDMDITVCQRRSDSGSYKQSSGGQGGQRKTKVTAKTKYIVVVKEKSGGPSLTASDLNPLLIVNAAGIPKVGRSCYVFGGLISPFLLCSSKQIERDSENPFVFHVSVDWESIEFGAAGGNAGASADQTTSPEEAMEPEPLEEFEEDNIATVVSFTTSSQEYVSYDSKFLDGSGSRQSWKLPTGTPFQEPIVNKVPLITLSITQFEDEITLKDLEERSYSVNKEEWNGRSAYHWMIAEIQAEEVELQRYTDPADPSQGLTTVTKWRVTYTVHLAPDHQIECVVAGEPYIPGRNLNVGDVYNPGWGVLRPLVDTFYKKEDTPPTGPPGPDYLVPNADPETGYVEACYIYEENGRKRTPTSTDGTGDDRPSYMGFMPWREIDFNDFFDFGNVNP